MLLPKPEPTLVESIARFRAAGFVGDFSIAGGQLVCTTCDATCGVLDVTIVDVVRFEGMSDPDDEAALFAMECSCCSARGLLVSAYGPLVDGETAAVLAALGSKGKGP
jgi:hypothetical protein